MNLIGGMVGNTVLSGVTNIYRLEIGTMLALANLRLFENRMLYYLP